MSPIRLIPRDSIRRHEWPAVIVAFLYFFCVLAAYYVIRPVRDQLSAAVGSIGLPLFYAATLVVTLALTPVFGALVARFPRRKFVPIVYLFFVAGMLAFIPLFRMQDVIGVRVLGVAFFVWVSVFNLFVVAVFWSFMADLFDAEQAHRLFPIIALGGPLGALAGPGLTRALVYVVGVPGLLVVSAVLLGLAIACIGILVRWSQRNPIVGDEQRNERIIGGGFLAGARQTLASPLLRRMALLMLLGDGVGTVIYALLADYSHVTYHTAAARIDFAAGVDLFANGLQIVLQVSLTRALMVRFGPVAALVLDGVVKAVLFACLILFGGSWIVVVGVISRASSYGVFKPASDSIYTRMDAEARYKAKNFIDTAVWRFGDLVVTSSFNALRSLGVVLSGFGLLAMLAAGSSAYVGWRVTRSPELREAPTEKKAVAIS